jgi:hypothetical protein
VVCTNDCLLCSAATPVLAKFGSQLNPSLFTTTLCPQSTAVSLSSPQSSVLSCHAIQRSVAYFVRRICVHSFQFARPTRASTGTTTMVTLPIHRRTHMTSETTPRIPSRLPMITLHTHSQRDTRHMVKNTNRVTHPRTTIPTQRHTDNPRHQITTKHTLRLLILPTRSLRHHRSPFSPHRSSSSSTWLSRQASLMALPISASLPHPH